MRMIPAAVALGLTLLCAGAACAQTAAEPDRVQRDARERVPAALLGTWKADIAASTYARTPPREHFRSFQYTADGKLMVSFLTLGATGAQSAGHWAVQLDGTPGLEYFAANGSTPYAEIRLTPVDDRTFTVTNARAGVQEATATYALSDEGRVLTITRTPVHGDRTVVVYHRWGAEPSTPAA